MERKVKLYANKVLAVDGMSHIPLLYPFWGAIVKTSMPYVMNALVTHGFSANYFEITQRIEDADYVLIPHDYFRIKQKAPEVLEKMIEEARAHGKPLLIDASSDQAGVVSVPNSRVLRINQYRYDLPSYEITVPVSCEDLLEVQTEGKLVLREKKEKASVGFVGWANLPLPQRIRSLIKELPVRLRALCEPRYATRMKGVFWRERAVQIFQASSRVVCNFIIRSSYSGHAATTVLNMEDIRREYIQNLLGNDYALVVRGDPNIATRFYEVLAIGRIPVLVDTECVLPLEDRINYRDFCVLISYKDLRRAPEILADFHSALSPERFISMQKRAREVYETYLRYDSYSKYLAEILLANPRKHSSLHSEESVY